jgi:hypothetical protein
MIGTELATVTTSKREAIGAELKKIIAKHGGIITPDQLVEAATPISHPLHEYFTWDDTEAAHRFRIMEARTILRVAVEYTDHDHEPIRVTAHLSSDDTGYRLLSTILSDTEMRAQLIADAGRDVDAFKRRYRTLAELQPTVEKLERAVSVLKAKRQK